MTMEEQYAAIGKAHAELKAKKQQLQALNLTADDLGKTFHRLGRVLQESPECAGLHGESDIPVHMVPPEQAELFGRKIFDADKFLQITNQIRETMRIIADLEEKLA
jgi:hypothetical protein